MDSLLINALGIADAGGGIARYARIICHGLARTWPGRVMAAVADREIAAGFPARCRLLRCPPMLAPGHGPIGNAGRAACSQALPRLRPGLHFAPSQLEAAIGLRRQVAMVHDLLPLDHPELHPRQRHWFRHLLGPLLRACPAVLAPSQHVRARLLDAYALDPRRVFAVHHGIAPVFSPHGPPGRWPRPYLLYVGRQAATKNIRLILAAHRLLRARGFDVDLLFSGRRPRAWPVEAGAAAAVDFIGQVGDAELAGFYRSALALVFPSKGEGFGFPVVEALACGCPVVCSRRGSLPEVAGDCAHFLEGEDAEETATLLARVILHGGRARLPRARAYYDWRRPLERHAQILALASRGGPGGPCSHDQPPDRPRAARAGRDPAPHAHPHPQ